jgi:hypothetical protein
LSNQDNEEVNRLPDVGHRVAHYLLLFDPVQDSVAGVFLFLAPLFQQHNLGTYRIPSMKEASNRNKTADIVSSGVSPGSV